VKKNNLGIETKLKKIIEKIISTKTNRSKGFKLSASY